MNYDLVVPVVLVVGLALKSDLCIVHVFHLNSRVQNFVFGVN